MNMIDKLLYGGFAVVAIGVVAAMLVTVFSPPKQLVEEAVETPPQIEPANSAPVVVEVEPTQQETEFGYYLNDDGNKVWLTAEDIAASDAIEAEFKRQEEEQKAREKAEKEWWESRKEWVERFPFEPTPHPEITHDPTVYDPVNVEEWPEEKVELYDKMSRIVDNHTFLKGFYDSKLPYTEEFEQMYDIVKAELGEELHPISLGWTFNALKKYHQAMQLDPDSIYRKNARVRRPVPPQKPTFVAIEDLPPEAQATFQNMTKQERIKFLVKTANEIHKANNPHFDNSYEVRDVIWRDEAEELKESILGELTEPPMPTEDDSLLMSMEKATEIRDRLLNEIPAAGFLKMPETGFAYSEEYEYELKPGGSVSHSVAFALFAFVFQPSGVFCARRFFLFCLTALAKKKTARTARFEELTTSEEMLFSGAF